VTRVLVIDDEPVLAEIMCETLERAGYETVGADDAERALALLEDETIGLVVSDIVMPRLTGIELLETVHRVRPSVPVLLVTGVDSHANLTSALDGGAAGLLAKPFTPGELVAAVDRARDRSHSVETDLRQRLVTPTLAGALANAIEAREASLQGHCERLASLAERIATELRLDRTELENVRIGAILHDIGKIGIPDRILLKPGALEPDEMAVMRTHTVIGDGILEPLDLLDGVRGVVRHHHERWDGAGYPDGLAGAGIPLAARIVSVADAVEAMSADRPYRRALPPATIMGELYRGRGAQWDPEIVDVVVDLIERGELQIGQAGLALLEAA
jgi:putative two-component system response regulator